MFSNAPDRAPAFSRFVKKAVSRWKGVLKPLPLSKPLTVLEPALSRNGCLWGIKKFARGAMSLEGVLYGCGLPVAARDPCKFVNRSPLFLSSSDTGFYLPVPPPVFLLYNNPFWTPSFKRPCYHLGNIFNVRHGPFLG
jgi:hypothetical protein